MEQKGNSACGAACVALAGILWGILGLFVRALGDSGLTPFDVVGVRALVAAGALLLFLLATDRRALLVRPRDLWCFLGTGLCSIVFFNYCYFTAVRMMSLASAAVLLYTAPAFVMLLSSALFGERLTRRRLAALLCTFLGCASVTGVFGAQQSLTLAGVLIGLGAGLGYALYTIFGRYALARGYQAPTITFYTFLIAAVVSSVLVGGWSQVGGVIKKGGSQVVLCMLALGVLSTVMAFLFYTIGLTKMESSYASVIASIEPVTASILGAVLYREKLSIWTIAGIALVLGAILIVNLTDL